MKKTLIAYTFAALALATYLFGSMAPQMPEVAVAVVLFALVTVSMGNAALQIYRLMREELQRRMLPALGLFAGLFAGIYTDLHKATQPLINSLFSMYADAAIIAVLVNCILLVGAYAQREGDEEPRTSSFSEL